jgi:molybdopterin converting factor small subunit
MATVFIPSLMQDLTGGEKTVEVPGGTVREIVNGLEGKYPGVKDRLMDGFRLKGNINVAVDGEISPVGVLGEVGESSEVHFLPAIAGGSLRDSECQPVSTISLFRRSRAGAEHYYGEKL